MREHQPGTESLKARASAQGGRSLFKGASNEQFLSACLWKSSTLCSTKDVSAQSVAFVLYRILGRNNEVNERRAQSLSGLQST